MSSSSRPQPKPGAQEPWIPACRTEATSHAAQTTATPKSSDHIMWNPSLNNSIDHDASYLIRPEDFDIEISPYTSFSHDGRYVQVRGGRLRHLLNAAKTNEALVTIHKKARARNSSGSNSSSGNGKQQRQSKNLCLLSCHTKSEVAAAIASNLRLPPCMSNNLRLLIESSRGQRRNVRFVFNCYVSKLLTCKKCDKHCLVEAMHAFYDYDKKCVREVNEMFEHEYMPPNCNKMKEKYKMCSRATSCKGVNPIHNF
ncbi:lef-2 [Leucania separata nucleopolyhedrovirus]|uniref:Lef-2 n=1 Tax=Leucania separata nucleopolyhedrovirus TaxID=1307956 RepID=Q0IKY2_NPVLS|nr:lef-2 [Leucania separata nucleopolyhedrovirus]AAR28901.1 lef-2 [Leucania separata nucleopolyhedrovirus]